MSYRLIKISKNVNFISESFLSYRLLPNVNFYLRFTVREKWERSVTRANWACQIVGGVHCPHVFAVFPRGIFCASNFYRRLLLVHRNLHLLTYRRCRVPHLCRVMKKRKGETGMWERESEQAGQNEWEKREESSKGERKEKGEREIRADAYATA